MREERFTEHQLKIYHDLYLPDRSKEGPLPFIIGFHGYEGNKESMMSRIKSINPHDFVIASVQGPNAFFVREGENADRPRIGFGWMMQYKMEETLRLHHETVIDLIDHLSGEGAIDRRAVFLMGFSQSVSLNYRFSFTHPGTIRGVVAVCGGIPGDWDSDKYSKSDTDVLIIAGDDDPFYQIERVRTFEPAMSGRARNVEFRSYPAGHVFPTDAHGLISDWLKARTSSPG